MAADQPPADVAAEQACHEVHHFRKRVEPRLVEQIAGELLADADRFTRSPLIAPRLAPVTVRQPVAADPAAGIRQRWSGWCFVDGRESAAMTSCAAEPAHR